MADRASCRLRSYRNHRTRFEQMETGAPDFPAKSLGLEGKYERKYELSEAAEGTVRTWRAKLVRMVTSFFVVTEESDGRCAPLCVSPDWPGAEAFAKRRLLLARITS
jgi:hypothetical protein